MAVSPIDELLLATNVAERMRFARPGPPGPILGLLRAPSDVEARALARRLAPVPGLDLDRRGARAADWSAGRERSMGGIAPGLQEGASR